MNFDEFTAKYGADPVTLAVATDVLDELVIETLTAKAAEINNGGTDAQLEFLADWPPDSLRRPQVPAEVIAAIDQALAERLDPAPERTP